MRSNIILSVFIFFTIFNTVGAEENCDDCCATTQRKRTREIGMAVEEHQAYIIFFPFWNQLLDNGFFYELRVVGGRDFIVNNPPATVPPISVKKEKSQYIVGGVGIFGVLFPINDRVSVLPFIRLQAYTNQAGFYKDSLGNEIHSESYTGYLGLRMNLKVNDVLLMYGNFFAGYRRTNLHAKGIFNSHGKNPHINSLVSTFEFGCPYNIMPCWFVTPYLQFNVSDNNPNNLALNGPIRSTGLTTIDIDWGLRMGYKF